MLYTKICTKCKKEKDLTNFYLRSDGQGHRSHCKECHSGTTEIICTVCGLPHTRFATNRKSDICESCYPRYRTLYNIFYAAKQRAAVKGLEFSLSFDWIMKTPNTCPKTGMLFTYTNNGNNYGNRAPTTPSIDKIDPSKGYTEDNCQVVCWWYNAAKQQFTDLEVLDLCKKVVTTYEMSLVQNVDS